MILDLIPGAALDAPDPLERFGGQLVERAKRDTDPYPASKCQPRKHK